MLYEPAGRIELKLHELDSYFRGLMDIDGLVKVDSSLNGIQVGRKDKEVEKVAFAVDACLESFRRCVESGADVLFVHHGLFWGDSIRVTGSHYKRLKLLIENDCALYACHLPLDQHPEFGNNAGLATALGIKDPQPFGEYHGVKIGLKGILDPPQSIDDILRSLAFDRDTCNAVFTFGKSENSNVGIVSGGAAWEVQQAIDEGLDLYLTGDASHGIYHLCLEESINLISGGHYQTEVWGVSLLADKVKNDTGLESLFIDLPTGL